MAKDPFPRDRVGAMLRRLPAYLRLAWRLARDPLLSRARRAGVVAAAGYLASPIDLVPGIIPVVGQLDDVAVALGALKFALAGLDGERRREHLAAVGLDDEDLTEDLRTVGATSAWLVRAGARTTGRVARRGGRAALAGARIAASVAQQAAPIARAAATKVAPTARSVASGGAAAMKDVASKRPQLKVGGSIHRLASLGMGRSPRPEEDRLQVEDDAIELPAPDRTEDP
jgi:uncharacterized membrane protein YkvA (DUF1232 family)